MGAKILFYLSVYLGHQRTVNQREQYEPQVRTYSMPEVHLFEQTQNQDSMTHQKIFPNVISKAILGFVL